MLARLPEPGEDVPPLATDASLDEARDWARARASLGTCTAYVAHCQHACTEPDCAKRTHYRLQMLLHASREDCLVEVGHAVRALERRGNYVLPTAPEAAARAMFAGAPQLVCTAGSPCACHACTPQCQLQAAIVASLSQNPTGATGATGVTWGLLQLDPSEVYLHSKQKWFRIFDLADQLRQRVWHDDAVPWADAADPADLARARVVDCCVPPNVRRMRRVPFEAFLVNGVSVAHHLLGILPAAATAPADVVILISAVDHTEPDGERTTFLFTPNLRQTKVRVKELKAEATRGGYLTFLVYLALRANRAVETPFAHILDRRTVAPPGTEFLQMLPVITEHVDSAHRLAPHEQLVALLKTSRKSTQARGAKTERRLAIAPAALHQARATALGSGGAGLVYSGIADASKLRKIAHDSKSARGVADTFMHVTLADAAYACLDVLNESKRLALAEEAAVEDEVARALVREAIAREKQGDAAGANLLYRDAARVTWESAGALRADRVR